MTLNLLEVAIENNEAEDFFRGRGQYHIPSPDYEGHLHGANMGGFARVFAESSEINSTAFDNAFLVFLQSLAVSKEDVGHLLSNLSSYFALKNRGGFPDSRIFENSTSQGSVMVLKYLEEVNESALIKDVKDQVLRHAKFISGKGNNLLDGIAKKLLNN